MYYLHFSTHTQKKSFILSSLTFFNGQRCGTAAMQIVHNKFDSISMTAYTTPLRDRMGLYLMEIVLLPDWSVPDSVMCLGTTTVVLHSSDSDSDHH